MPYIVQSKRDLLDPIISQVQDAVRQLESDDPLNDTGGNLNYLFSRILRQCYGKKYSEMAEAVSVLEMAKQEYYRTVAGPYEDQKKFDNGDI